MKINNLNLLEEMKNLAFYDGDARPVWVGPELADTDNADYKNHSKWANEHWGLYRGFLHLVEEAQERTILDLGSGCGFCTINLSSIFNDCILHAYDIDDKSILFANKFNKNERINYYNKDILKTQIIKADYIFLIETLEHIKHKNHYELIDNCLSSLKPNGLLFISTPNEETFSLEERGHIGILTPKFFNEFKNRYNKNILEIKYFDNTKLLNDVEVFTTDIPSSHFKIVLKK